ncbi:(S)-benzoin forming benzil reductase [Cohnella sp.]|uniref:(S)-benzoin forming benzil reductase n=1 Tax=Cohnella sp. TaxID=1883426 RepID=UPI003567A7BF
MNCYIITGTSRGLGEAIAEKLLVQGNHVFCISRNQNAKLVELADDLQVPLEYIQFDLARVNDIDLMMKNIFLKMEKTSVRSVVLINNAGILAPIKPIELCSSEEIIMNTQINLTAPMILTSEFISNTSDMQSDKQIINISSGAGKKPYYGWSNYCSAKAGLDLFTRCVGVEQAAEEYPVRVLSISPGVIDTEMQQEIRMTPKENFHSLDRFLALKENGDLQSPSDVAAYILKIIANKDIPNGELLDIRDQK